MPPKAKGKATAKAAPMIASAAPVAAQALAKPASPCKTAAAAKECLAKALMALAGQVPKAAQAATQPIAGAKLFGPMWLMKVVYPAVEWFTGALGDI